MPATARTSSENARCKLTTSIAGTKRSLRRVRQDSGGPGPRLVPAQCPQPRNPGRGSVLRPPMHQNPPSSTRTTLALATALLCALVGLVRAATAPGKGADVIGNVGGKAP